LATLAQVSDRPVIETDAEAVQALAGHVVINPPDGAIRLTVGENGSLLSEWTSGGRRVSIGEVTTHPQP
jgi:hypothetical protein